MSRATLHCGGRSPVMALRTPMRRLNYRTVRDPFKMRERSVFVGG